MNYLEEEREVRREKEEDRIQKIEFRR